MIKTAYIEQITAYFNGQLSSAQEQGLYNWIKADKRNFDLFKAEKAKLNPAGIHHDLLESSLAELKMKLDLNRQFKPGRKVFMQFSRAAAIFILLVSLGFVFSQVLNNFKNISEEIVWFETTAPRGEKSKINLPDGSVVWLNSETTIRYPHNFTADNRNVELKGEAYFEVEKYKEMPFTVKTKDYTINVLGTKFNVMAYSDFNRTETALIEGKVQIEKNGKIIDVKPGEEITFENNQFTIRNKN
ncbi:MAG: FecR domain-containing protein, partial [Bacteroidales bacterium]|nr:FecR domain-containing protein [Bacteroidales bacterium]